MLRHDRRGRGVRRNIPQGGRPPRLEDGAEDIELKHDKPCGWERHEARRPDRAFLVAVVCEHRAIGNRPPYQRPLRNIPLRQIHRRLDTHTPEPPRIKTSDRRRGYDSRRNGHGMEKASANSPLGENPLHRLPSFEGRAGSKGWGFRPREKDGSVHTPQEGAEKARHCVRCGEARLLRWEIPRPWRLQCVRKTGFMRSHIHAVDAPEDFRPRQTAGKSKH